MPALGARAATTLLCALLTAATGCGSSDADGGGPDGKSPNAAGGSGAADYDGPRLPETPGPLPLDELGDGYEELLCEALIRCEGRPYRDVAHCRGDIEADGLADVLDGVAQGRIAYDADAMGACRRVFEQNLCAVSSLFLFVPSVPQIMRLCAGTATTGSQAAGQPCRGPLECGRDLYCDDEAACPGVCRARKALGAACASDDECERAGDIPDLSLADVLEGGEPLVEELSRLGADCFRDSCRHVSLPGDDCLAPETDGCAGDITYCDVASGKCVERGGEGQACSFDGDECASRHWCDIAQDAAPGVASGTCRPDGGEGEPCRSSSDCDDALRCIPEAGGARGLCASPSARDGACARNGDCADGLGCADGSCVELPGPGSPCLSGACAKGAICDAGQCRRASFPGEVCDESERVCLGLCRDGTCGARLELGEPCSAGADCQSRACEDGSCIDDELCESR